MNLLSPPVTARVRDVGNGTSKVKILNVELNSRSIAFNIQRSKLVSI